jgi:hypothetical protein
MGAYDDLINVTQLEAPPAAGANAYADLIQKPASEQAQAETPSIAHQLERGAGLSARALIEGAVGLPAQVADVGHSLYSLATDPQARSATWEQMKHPSQWLTPDPSAPSQQFSRALNPYLPQPQTAAEKVMSVGLGMEGGAMMPQVPIPGAKAPANFMTPDQQKAQRLAQSLKEAQDAGFVVPPSTTNPALGNRALETVAGKESTQNQARVINQNARNELAAQDLGLKPEVFTPEAVAAVKKEAGQGFEAARGIPTVTTDDQYVNDLSSVLKETRGSNASFPGSANPDVERIVDTYLQPNFTGDSAVSAIKLLRGKASDAYRQGNSELGMAYKGVSSAIESQLERGAQSSGGAYTDLVQAMRQARQTYAKASTIEDAMDANGNVSGIKLAAAWRRGEPLSGGMLLSAEHAVNFPKANLPANSSNIHHLDTFGTLLGAGVGEHALGPAGLVAGAAWPAARYGARSYLLSGAGQAGARPAVAPSRAASLARALARPTVAAGAVNDINSQ